MKAPAKRLAKRVRQSPAGTGRRNGAYGDSAGNARDRCLFLHMTLCSRDIIPGRAKRERNP